MTVPAPTAERTGDRNSNCRPLRDAKEAVIVQESTVHDSTSMDICRRHSIATSMLFRRRTMVGYGSGGQMKLRGC
jgi:transposase-like protein